MSSPAPAIAPRTAAALSHHETFVSSVCDLTHDRLKDALLSMLAGGPSDLLTSHQLIHELQQRKPTATGLLQGDASPDRRVLLSAEMCEDIHARFPDAFLLELPRAELDVTHGRTLAGLLTPPLRSPIVMAELRYVNLSDNALTHLGTDFSVVRNILFQLARAPGLIFLSLHNNMLLAPGAVEVARLLRTSTSLEALDLSRNSLGDRGARALYAGLCRERDFDAEAALREEGMSDEAAAPETEAAASDDVAPTGGVTESKTETPAPAPATAATPTAPAAGDAPARPRSARGSRPGSARAMTASGKLLVRPSSAKPSAAAAAVDASAGGVRVEAADDTSGDAALRRVTDAPNESLVWLDLSENNLTGFGLEPRPACALMRAVLAHPRLRYLDLSRNRLTRAAISAINIGLELNKTLQTLILDGNDIDAVPASEMADILHGHPSLSHVSLRYNRVRSDGAASFARLLTARDVLMHLDLRDNYVGEVGTRAVLEAMGVDVPPETKLTDIMAAAAPTTPSEEAPPSAREPPPPEGEVVVAGSGAAAILALRKQARRRASSTRGPGALASPEVDAPWREGAWVTEDGVIMRAMHPATAMLSPVPEGDEDLTSPPAATGPAATKPTIVGSMAASSSRVRVVLLDPHTIQRVLKPNA